jgi:diadenosine tetraphosphate (Ap4A) HIT family hydrolase
MRRSPWRRWSWCRIQHWEAITSREARESGPARDGDNVVLKDGRAAFQSVFHIHLHVVPRQNGDNKLSFAKGMLLRRDPDREKTGRTLREALEKIDATE